MKKYGPYILGGYRAWLLSDPCRSDITVYEHREVAAVMLGRSLTMDEVVHHRDGDKLNNAPSNLLVMTRSAHAKEHAALPELYRFTCPECGKESVKFLRYVRHNKRQGKEGPFCGRSCAGRYNQRKRTT
jgi:hypothetical protein